MFHSHPIVWPQILSHRPQKGRARLRCQRFRLRLDLAITYSLRLTHGLTARLPACVFFQPIDRAPLPVLGSPRVRLSVGVRRQVVREGPAGTRRRGKPATKERERGCWVTCIVLAAC